MAQFLAVSNRKGGVGKSTIAVMLAHAAAAWSGRRAASGNAGGRRSEEAETLGAAAARHGSAPSTARGQWSPRVLSGANKP